MPTLSFRSCKPILLVAASVLLFTNASGCAGCRGGNVNGKVVDQDGKPLKGVLVAILGKTDKTDAKGRFEIRRIPDFPEKRVVAHFEKDGYFKHVGGARVREGDVFISIALTERKVVGTVDNRIGGVIRDSGITAMFPPNQWMDQNGTVVEGAVTIYAARVNPDSLNFAESMPGRDFTARGGGTPGALVSAGALLIEAEDESGNPVDVAKSDEDEPVVIENDSDADGSDDPGGDDTSPWGGGDTSWPGAGDTSTPGDTGDTGGVPPVREDLPTICLDIPATMLGVVPDEIPLWQLGGDGIWTEVAMATRIEDQFCFVMVGTGSLNCDLFSRTGLIQGTVCNRKGEPVGEGRSVAVFQNTATTDSAGQYGALVPACYTFDATARGETIEVPGIPEGKTRTVDFNCTQDTGTSAGVSSSPFASSDDDDGSDGSDGGGSGTDPGDPFGGSSGGSSGPVVIEDGSDGGSSSSVDTGSWGIDTGFSSFDTGTSTGAASEEICTTGDDTMLLQAASAPTNISCGILATDQGIQGGDTPWTGLVDVKQTSGTLTFKYETQSEEDRMIVSQEGVLLFDSGCVGTNGWKNKSLTFSGTTTDVTVSVMPTCAGGSGTQWDFKVECP